MTPYTPESVERLWDAIDAEAKYNIGNSPVEIAIITKSDLAAALASLTEEKDVCEWVKTEDDTYFYRPSCVTGIKSIFSFPQTFCPYCGKPIKEVTNGKG